MPMFRYQVTDRSGKMLSGAMNAATEADVRRKLESQGYGVRAIIPPPEQVAARPAPAPAPTRTASVPTRNTTAPPAEMVMLFRQLQTMLHSGMPLYQALATIAGQTRSPGMAQILATLTSRVQAGERLSAAMAEFPRAFAPHVIGVVASGEVGGFLPQVLGDIALDYEIEQKASVRWVRITQNLLWINAFATLLLVPAMPNIPVIVKGGVQGFLQAYFSDVMTFIVPPMAIVLAVYLAARVFLRRPDMRPVADILVLRVPVAGRASRERSLANFSRMLWRLQSSGILPMQAWDTASMASNNSLIARRLREQLGALQSGARLSQAMQATGLFREDERQMLEVGEISGQTPDVLYRMAAFYEQAAYSSSSRVRSYGLRIAILVNLIVLAAVAVSEFAYISNLISIAEQEFEPMIWLLSPTR